MVPLIEEALGTIIHATNIFFKNLSVAVICFLTARITKGILPAIVLLFKGLVVGVFAIYVSPYTSIADIFQGIAPHGIIEFPALFIACAIGMQGINRAAWKAFSVPAFMLLVAATVEVLVTPLVAG